MNEKFIKILVVGVLVLSLATPMPASAVNPAFQKFIKGLWEKWTKKPNNNSANGVKLFDEFSQHSQNRPKYDESWEFNDWVLGGSHSSTRALSRYCSIQEQQAKQPSLGFNANDQSDETHPSFWCEPLESLRPPIFRKGTWEYE